MSDAPQGSSKDGPSPSQRKRKEENIWRPPPMALGGPRDPDSPTPSGRMRQEWAHNYLDDAPPEKDPGRSSLPWSEALRMSLQSIRLRLGRLSVVLIGIALAISFVTGLSYIQLMTDALHEMYRDSGGGGNLPAANPMQLGWKIIAILIAAAGIANAVLMSVTERIQEIGTLKCLGARNRHIIKLFMVETLCLGFFGGLAGGILGPFLAMGLQFFMIGTEVAAGMSWGNFGGLVAYGIGLSLTLTILAAVVPVSFAARVESAEAMRYHV